MRAAESHVPSRSITRFMSSSLGRPPQLTVIPHTAESLGGRGIIAAPSADSSVRGLCVRLPLRGPQAAFSTQSRMALAGLLLLAAGLRIWIANFQPNLIWADEIYQVVEPAHRLVYGTGLTAW